MNIELDVERKATPLSAFPKNEHGKPGIFVKKAKDDKAEYCCFCIKDIYSDLFAGTKKRAGDNADDSALIYFPKNPHTIKQNKELLRFLLPQELFEQIEKNTQDGKQYVKDYDYKEFFLVSTNNNKITKLLFSLFSTEKMGSEKHFIESIQAHFVQILKNAEYDRIQLNKYLCNMGDRYLVPFATSKTANRAFHSLIDSDEHDSLSKVIANVFISAMLGLYSIKYLYGYKRTYLLNNIGMEFIWTPESISSSYVKLQDALYSYKCGLYEEAYRRGLTWLAECGSTARKSELATANFILGACLCQYPDYCNLGNLTNEAKKKLRDYLPTDLLVEDNSVAHSETKKAYMQSEGSAFLEKSVSLDNSLSEAFFILYSYYNENNKQRAFDCLSAAYAQTYIKAVIEVANRSVKGQKQLPEVTDDDVIEKLTTIIFNEPYYSEIEVSECLYLRGQLRLKLDVNKSEAISDFETAAQKGHEKARQELSRKERMERQLFPSFLDDPDTPCCFANSLDGNNLVFISTLPDGEWRLFTTEQKNPAIDKSVTVKSFDEFAIIQNLTEFDSYIHKVILLFSSEDEDRNLNECLIVLDKLFNIALEISEKQRKSLMDNIEIFVGAKYEIASALIDANINDMGEDIYFKVHIIDETRDSSHQLLCDAPLFLPLISNQKRDDSVNVVLFGCSETNYRIIKESIGCAYLGKEHPVCVTMLGTGAGRMDRRLRQECPGIFHEPHIECIRPKFISCCIEEEDFPNLIYGNLHDAHPDNDLVKTLSDGNYFVVDLSSDQESIRFAMELRTWLLRSRGTFDRTPFISVKCRNSQNSYLASHLTLSGQAAGDTYYSRYDLFPFGITRVLYSYNRLVENPRLEEVALQIHKSYYGGDDRRAENDYYSFSYNADSSLLTAIGLSYRLFAGGSYFSKKEQYLNYGAFDSVALLSDYAEAIKPKEDYAASLEQSRWNGFMLSRGWESADLNQVKAYKDQTTGISHKHTLAKLHPFIREWGELDSDDLIQILGMLQSRFDYNKHPKTTTRKSIKDTPKFLCKPVRDNGKTH